MPATDVVIELPKGPVRVRIHGDQGPALFWTHGVFHPIDVDDRSPLGPVFDALPEWRVIRYDTRGQGRTPPLSTDAEHRWDALADELLALADALEIDRFFAGGISMGAAITLHAALRAPQRIRGLVLLAPPTAWETRPEAQESYRALAALDGPRMVAAQVASDLERDFAGAAIPEALRFMVEQIAQCDATALGRVLRAAAESDLPAKQALASLGVPTLLLPWVGDAGHPMSTAEALQETLPEAQTVVLDGVSDTEKLVTALRAFLRSALRT
jgi:pimeloyl-ACP methyl ester carboxylesterase